MSVKFSNDVGFSGSKFLSSKIELNLLFLLAEPFSLGCEKLICFFSELDLALEGARSSKFSLWAFPITAFRVVSPSIPAISLAV